MSKLPFRRTLAIGVLASALGLATSGPSFATPDDDGIKKVAALISASGYHNTQATQKVWSIDFNGKALPHFDVIVAAGELSVIFTIVVKHDQYTMTPELAKKLLTFDSSMDRVKIGTNEDGDIFVRADVTARTLDEQDFKAVVEQVAAATDEVYGGIKPLLGKSPFH